MTENQQGGIGIASVIGIVFLISKLVGWQPIASWSWVWILSPWWIPLSISVLCQALIMILCARKR